MVKVIFVLVIFVVFILVMIFFGLVVIREVDLSVRVRIEIVSVLIGLCVENWNMGSFLFLRISLWCFFVMEGEVILFILVLLISI